jgi:subtilisin family serine protease
MITVYTALTSILLKVRAILATILLFGLLFTALPTSASSSAPPVTIYLQRGAFDPLRSVPLIAALTPTMPGSQLALIQLDAPPDSQAPARLAAAGLRPLAYIPDNTFLVRTSTASKQSITSLAGVRWSGPFAPAYKLPAELDPLLSTTDTVSVELRLIATPDTDAATLAHNLEALGGQVLGHGDSMAGPTLHMRLPALELRTLVARDDILWVERYVLPSLLNDRARRIMGVDSGRQQLGLDGSGQIIAVTDTGLDIQADVLANRNPDFPTPQIARGFTQHEMNAACSEDTWSDARGHGTHVAGIILGSGARSPAGVSFAGMAPGARLVVESGGADLSCLDISTTAYLANAYDAGARVQNASWGLPGTNGGYDDLARMADDFLWNHKDHLFVVAAGNGGEDSNMDGVIDPDSINSPATAKNVLSVGASENDRPPEAPCSFSGPEGWCWDVFGAFGAPIANDPVSDNPNGLAAFSSRGPTDDGRIKPEIVAPGTNIVSTRSHAPNAAYPVAYNDDYAYDSGTSMAAPMISGMAALVRQWLAEQREVANPSAALVKALLLNGATNIAPGQYGTGAEREIPAAWPSNVAGWGRATLTDTVGLNAGQQIWFHEDAGLQTGAVVSYTLAVDAGKPLRVTLAWTDYPAAPVVQKTLVNDLDLEIVAPDGTIVRGNTSADLPTTCRVGGYDRCNNVESVEIAGSSAGNYTLRVRGAVVPFGPQPFALVARTAHTVVEQTPDDPGAPSAPESPEIPALHTLFLPLIRNG